MDKAIYERGMAMRRRVLGDAYVDGTMVSAKGWTALAAFIRECLKVLGTEIRHA